MATDKQTDLQAKSDQQGASHAPAQGDAYFAADAENPLSEREKEVSRLLVTGATNTEIARELVISPHTVKVHLRNVFEKLQVSSRTEASMVLLQRGWVIIPGVSMPEAVALAVGPDAAPAVAAPEPEPLADLDARPAAWQLGMVGAVLLLCLLALSAPGWLRQPKTSLGLLSDSGQTVVGPPSIESLARWEVKSSLEPARSRLAAVQTGGRIYAAGGEGSNGTTLAAVAVFDLEQERWTDLSPLPAPRANHSMAAAGSELIVAGGSINHGAAVTLYDDLLRYTMEGETWEAAGKLPEPLAGSALLARGDMLFLLGGWDGSDMRDEVWRLPRSQMDDAAANDWAVIARLPTAAAFFGATLVDQRIYVAGGYDGRKELAGAAFYDLANGAWTHLPPLTMPRSGLQLVHDGVTVVALGGGWTQAVQTHERLDAATQQWISLSSPIQGEWRHFGAAVNNGSIYLLGGWSGDYLETHQQFQSTFRALLPVIPNVSEED